MICISKEINRKKFIVCSLYYHVCSGRCTKSVRGWWLIGQSGDSGQNTVFKANSRQYNPFFSFLLGKNENKNS